MASKLYSMSSSERISRGARLLFRAMRPRYDALHLPEKHFTPEGFEYHIYYPSGKAFRTVILIYGMTIEGKDDPRLIKFARSCASVGLKVVVPDLPGLMDFLVQEDDMRRLEAITWIVGNEGAEKIGLIGFSTGGSYALLLAGHPTLRELIGPLVLFSPIYDVRAVADYLHAPFEPPPATEKDWDQYYWSQYVITLRNCRHLGLSEAVQDGLKILLADYEKYQLEVKRIFYDNHVAPLKLVGRTDLFHEGEILDRLSAQGQLKSVKSPVFILHDASDHLVPPDQSRRMVSELARRGAGFRQKVLVTPWLSHVTMKNFGSPAELFQIISYISELFRVAS